MKCVSQSVTSRSVLFTWCRLDGCWICYCLWCQTIVRFRTKNMKNAALKTSPHTRWMKMQSLWLRNWSIYQATSAGRRCLLLSVLSSCSLSCFACSSCKFVLEERPLQHPHGAEKEMNEFKKLQVLSDLMREQFSALQPCLIKSSRGSQSTAPDKDELSSSLSNPVVPRQSAVNGWRPVWSCCQVLNGVLKVREAPRPILMMPPPGTS